jgi:hypothetical protein
MLQSQRQIEYRCDFTNLWSVGGVNKEYGIQEQSQLCTHGAKDIVRILVFTADATCTA